MPVVKRLPAPLDGPALERLALRYVERFATTRARLTRYLDGKLRARGFTGDRPDTVAIAQRFAEAGYIDDRAFGEARARAMARRGLGARRIAVDFRHAGIDAEDSQALAPDIAERAIEAALAYARRRRIGPFGDGVPDRPALEKQIAAMIRGGHDFALARRIASMPPGQDTDLLSAC